MYDSQCGCCGGLVPDLADNIQQFEAIYMQMAWDILNGSASDINTDLYFKTAGVLMDGVKNGLGGFPLAYDDERAILGNYLQNNIYAFAGAKSLTEMLHYRNLMLDKDGKILEYSAYKNLIIQQGDVFSNKYLKAEYDAAKYSAIMAHKWDTLDSEYLEYSTVGDRRVRPEHAILDKFTALKSDPVWNKIYPIKAYGCRCNVGPGKAQNAGKTMSSIEAAKMMNPHIKDTIFDNHVGKSKVIFNDNHPYFKNSKGDVHNLSWQQYGLKPIDKIRVNPLPEYAPMSKDQYQQWWDKQPKWKGQDIVIRDVIGQEVLLSSGAGKSGKIDTYFKEHILKKPAEKRHEYAAETTSILKSPDEIWHNGQGRVYVKYYEQGTLKLVVTDELEAKTLFKIYENESGELQKTRRGTLLYKK